MVNFGGSFLGLMVFLIYLAGMLVVFGYTAAMAIEEYPEVWVSHVVVFGAFVMGVVSICITYKTCRRKHMGKYLSL